MRLREGRIKYLIIFLVSIAISLTWFYYRADNFIYLLITPTLFAVFLGKDFYDRVGMFLISAFAHFVVVPFIIMIMFAITFGGID